MSKVAQPQKATTAPAAAAKPASPRRARKRADGEGTLSFDKKARLWRGSLMVGMKTVTTADGKLLQRPDRRKVSGRTQELCRQRLDALKQQRDGQQLVDTPRLTVGAFLTRWLEDSARPSVKPNTYTSYEVIVRRHLVPGLGHHQLKALTPAHVQQFYAARLKAGLSPRGVRYCHALLHRALKLAVKWGLAPRNVTESVDQPQNQRHELATLDQAAALKLLDATAGTTIGAILAVALGSGARRGEILALKWTDLDGRRLSINRTLLDVTADGQPVFGSPKTDRSRRQVTLPAYAVDALAQHRDRQAFERAVLKNDYADHGLVFAQPTGAPLTGDMVRHRFAAALALADVPVVRFHDLRHTSATLSHAAGASLKAVSDRLGHSTITITADLYQHHVRQVDEDVADKLDAMLRPRPVAVATA
jgi:integrase